MQRMWGWLGGGILAVALAWGAVNAVEAWQFRGELSLAKREWARGRHASASSRLARLSARWPGQGEVEYMLGICEQGAGRLEEAGAAWARVPEGSPHAVPAALMLAKLEMGRGRYSSAEHVLLGTLTIPGPESIGARRLLAEVLWEQGRYDELSPILEANWEIMDRPDWANPGDALEVLRSHLAMDFFPLPVDRIKATLDRVESLAPDDDRIWLAQANFSIRTGNLAEAGRRLELCLRRRPDDPAVWRSRLDWAKATGALGEARVALAHIPADSVSPGRVADLRAWYANRRGDEDAERGALERLVELEPGNTTALERLAEQAVRAGRDDQASELRRRKAEIDRVLHRYRNLLEDNRLVSHAGEMSGLAESLGRRFEARAFLTLAARQDPSNPEIKAALARLGRRGLPAVESGRTLASVLAGKDDADLADSPPDPGEAGKPALSFSDDAGSAGLAFVYDNGESSIHQLPETAGGGVGLLDYDGDGRLDIYVVQGGTFPPDPRRPSGGDRLFRNKGDGTFEDATELAGLKALAPGYGHGVSVGDVDNDGHPDLFVTRWDAYALYRNKGDGTFEDATERWGLGGTRPWPTSAAFADLDNDGDLDLYVCHYGAWDPAHPQLCRSPGASGYISCAPRLVVPLPDRLFRNDGGRFVDATREAGIVDNDGRGLGVVAADVDDDGRVDLYVANDGTANFLFRNMGGLRFEEVGMMAGVAANANGGYQAGMGVSSGDLDGDGRIDLVVTNFYGESTTFFQNLGHGQFADRSEDIGLARASRYLLGFGVSFLDADNDGWLDLMTANGHVSDSRPHSPYQMPLQLLRGGPGPRLVDVSARSGSPFLAPHLGRGMATGDLDDDGRIDAIVVLHNEPMLLLHNRSRVGHSLTLSLEGRTSHRDAVGTRVAVRAGGRNRVAQRVGGGSYQSASDQRLHFGLGEATRVELLEVRWPSGQVQQFTNMEVDAAYHLREGISEAKVMSRRASPPARANPIDR